MTKAAMAAPVEILPDEPLRTTKRKLATKRPVKSDMMYLTNFAPKKV
jgi:hypothetical protein